MFRRDPKLLVSLFAEEAAASERLKDVTARGRGEESLYAVAEEEPKAAVIQRRFWSPNELIGASL